MEPTLVAAGINALGGALSSKPAAGPSFARADNMFDMSWGFDNSGWTVNFGDNAEVNPQRQQLPAVGGGINTTMIVIVIGGLVAWRLAGSLKKK